MITQRDARPSDTYPTDTWYAGVRITTTHTLTLPADARGEYRLELGMYNYPAQERLPIIQNGAALDNSVLVLP